MLTFITPESLQSIVKACGGHISLDAAATYLAQHQSTTLSAEDLDEASSGQDLASYHVALGVQAEGKILTVQLIDDKDSGVCGGVEISVRAGVPDFVITDIPLGSPNHAQAKYRLNVVATPEGALVSAEEPFDAAGALSDIPFPEDVESDVTRHVLESRYVYKTGHFLGTSSAE